MTRLARVRMMSLPTFSDSRGMLTALEADKDVPFKIRRLFYVYNVQPPFERGGHAHPDTEQLLVCVCGSLKIDVSDPSGGRTYLLDDPSLGLYVPELVWTRLYDFTADAVCLAAASTHYGRADVIRDWGRYVELARVVEA